MIQQFLETKRCFHLRVQYKIEQHTQTLLGLCRTHSHGQEFVLSAPSGQRQKTKPALYRLSFNLEKFLMYHCAWRIYNSLKGRGNSGGKVNSPIRWREISELRFTVLVRGIIGCSSACMSDREFQLEEARREKWCAQVYMFKSMHKREAVHV